MFSLFYFYHFIDFMIIILSPSKTMVELNSPDSDTYIQPQFFKQAKVVSKTLKKLSEDDIAALMKVSPKIASQNFQRFQNLTNEKNATVKAIYAYKGEVFTGLNAAAFTQNQIESFNSNIYILSAVYGALSPLDSIQPYRLEMAQGNFKVDGKSLYEFWKEPITTLFKNKIDKNNLLINLASDEYFKLIKVGIDDELIIHINFREFRNGEWKFISTNAKQARGTLAHFILANKINKIEDIKKFNLDGYKFNKELSIGNKWIFGR